MIIIAAVGLRRLLNCNLLCGCRAGLGIARSLAPLVSTSSKAVWFSEGRDLQVIHIEEASNENLFPR